MLYLPEGLYTAEKLDRETLERKFALNEFIRFKITDWIYEKRGLIAEFENGITGFLPESEICIEELKFTSNYTYPVNAPVQAKSLIGKTACALISEINGDEVILSRKALQQKALTTLTTGKVYNVVIKGISRIGLFVDVAVGISAFIHNSEISKTKFRNIEDFKFEKDMVIPAMLIQTQNNIKMSFRRALTFPPLSKDDYAYGIVRNALYDGTGYFIEISPNDTGIVDTTSRLVYGERILVIVKYSETSSYEDDYYVKHHVDLAMPMTSRIT